MKPIDALRQADRHCDMEGLPPASPAAIEAEQGWLEGATADDVVEKLKKRFTGTRESSVPRERSEPRTSGGGD